MYEELLSNLASNSLILTVNQRLSAHLLLEYAKLQPSPVFPTPPIVAVNTWLKQLWEQQQQHKQLLDSSQAHCLWQQVIEKSSHTDFILPIGQVSRLAQEAYAQVHGWQIPWSALQASDDKDHQTFVHWAMEFESQLNKHHAITSAQLPHALQTIINPICLPKNMYLVGFQDMPPALSTLLDHLRGHCNITAVQPVSTSQSVTRTQASTNLAEITAMATWAKEKLLTAEQPHKLRLACVVPDLQALRKPIADIFQHTFRTANSPMTPEAIFPFNISAGQPLLHYPMIRDAFDLLSLHQQPIPAVAALSRLLTSPYLFPLENGMAIAAQLDARIRETQLTNLPLSQLMGLIGDTTELVQLRDFFSTPSPPSQFPSEWVQTWLAQLQQIGWPGTQSLSSEEFQLLGQWMDTLRRLSALDDLTGSISLSACLAQLQHVLSSQSFQPQTDHSNAPIQVLGLLEAAGLPFDYLWIMGLDDTVWPPAAQGNPFIPKQLQQQYQLPHHSGEHELAYCQQLQATLIHQARHTILSSPAQDQNNPKHPSALIAGIAQQALNELVKLPEAIAQPVALESFDENYAPALTAKSKLRGGTALASNQAACAFRAFALHRLDATALDETSFGVSPLLHGILLHESLEKIWRQLKDQPSLLALTATEQLDLVKRLVQKTMQQHDIIPSRFYHLEETRLVQQINDWLNAERERPSFAIAALEKNEMLLFSGHPMNVRLDRIDQLSDGKLVVIDYKTSRSSNPLKWLASPPLDSQLPLYASFSQDNYRIVGCSYAIINREETTFKGFISDEYETELPLQTLESLAKPGFSQNWLDAVQTWQQQIQAVIDSYIAGYAAVSPNPQARPCDFCELNSLCRLEEVTW